ncbi:hypothetical protein PSHT_07733 [Puccinia striiformis]|uniref:Myb/SANT-like domain-containing protein n=1 Tax=Puccinia striiformis TaxID=27350 RepID=A0A2S4VVM8_9BASI|nr:hypothetical protein PSHT_07733 [Puccinia striiformis]
MAGVLVLMGPGNIRDPTRTSNIRRYPTGYRGRTSQPLIEDPAILSEARSALLSSGTTSVSPTGTQTSLPGTTPGPISSSFTTPANTQNPVPIPSTQQSPTPNSGGQVPTQLTEETSSSFPEVEGGPGEVGTGKLHWTGAMEKSALQLYVAAVQSGKQSDGGFKIDVHRLIARDLAAEFPGIPFTGEKLRSKCNQGFKKWYDAFLACKDASGFGWNEQHNMVTASEESHPAARRFKNTPFPEYHKLFIIFGGHSATGALHRGIDGEGENNLDVTEEQTGPDAPDGVLGDDKNERSGAKGTTSGSQQAVPEVSSRVEQAIAKFQDDFAEGLSMEDLVAGFSILESESKANTFMAIRNEVHEWPGCVDRSKYTTVTTTLRHLIVSAKTNDNLCGLL